MDWISVKDRLPDKNGKYLVFARSKGQEKPFIQMGWYDPGYGWSLIPTVWVEAISHWMPLPSDPIE